MATKTYILNKGINRSIEFKGIKGQYILYLGAGLVGLLILFAILYISGLNPFICIGIVLIAGGALYLVVHRISSRYGEHGWMKKLARRNIPRSLKIYNRHPFYCKKLR